MRKAWWFSLLEVKGSRWREGLATSGIRFDMSLRLGSTRVAIQDAFLNAALGFGDKINLRVSGNQATPALTYNPL